MNTYPGFYRAVDGKEYLYLDKSNYFSFERGVWEKDEDLEEHKKDINITHEYLANTKVEIESEEHSFFIQELAFKYGYIWIEGLAKNIELSGGCIVFNEDSMTINHITSPVHSAYKPITIPLPPKESDVIDSLPEVEPKKIFTKEEMQTKEPEVVEGGICQAIKSSTAIHELESQGYKFTKLEWVSPNASKEPEPKEWPKVGDKVVTEGFYPLEVRGLDGANAWCLDSEGDYLTFNIDELKKPPTPEEELNEKLYNLFQCDLFEGLSKAIINGEIKGLSYKPE